MHAGENAVTSATTSEPDGPSAKQKDGTDPAVRLETVVVLQPDGHGVACALQLPAGSPAEQPPDPSSREPV